MIALLSVFLAPLFSLPVHAVETANLVPTARQLNITLSASDCFASYDPQPSYERGFCRVEFAPYDDSAFVVGSKKQLRFFNEGMSVWIDILPHAYDLHVTVVPFLDDYSLGAVTGITSIRDGIRDAIRQANESGVSVTVYSASR